MRSDRDLLAFVLSEAAGVAAAFAARRLVGATEVLEARNVRFVVLVVVRFALAVCAVFMRLVLVVFVPLVLAAWRSFPLTAFPLTATAFAVAVLVAAREDVVREVFDDRRALLPFAEAAPRTDFATFVVFALPVVVFATVPRLVAAVVLVVLVVRFAAAAVLRVEVFLAGGCAVAREVEARRRTLTAALTTVLRVEVFLDFFGATVFRAVRFAAVLADFLADVFASFVSFAGFVAFVVFVVFAVFVTFVVFATFAVLAAFGAMEREVLRDGVTALAVRFVPAALRADALVVAVVSFLREVFSWAVAFDDFVLVDLPTDLPVASVFLVEAAVLAVVLVGLFAALFMVFGDLRDAAAFDAFGVLIFVVFEALAVLDTLVALETPALVAFFEDFVVVFFEDTLLAFFVAV